MRSKALLLRHMPTKRDDRVSRRLAELGFELDWRCPAQGDPLPVPGEEHRLAVVYGGVQSANDAERCAYIRAEIDWIARWVAGERPFLGLCLGAQLLARALGARVAHHPEGLHEIGYVQVRPTPAGAALMGEPLHVYQWHREGFELPPGAELLATGERFPNQAFRADGCAYGLQFHPEVTVEIMGDWMAEAGEMLVEPGAHPRERQLADAGRFDSAMGAWLAGFLDRWVCSELAPSGD